MHHQVVVLEDELGLEMTIDSISYMIGNLQYTNNYLSDVSIYMGLTDLDVLTETYDDNYLPGTKQLVLSSDSVFYGYTQDEWYPIALQQSFHYPGQDNLIIEIVVHDCGFSPVYNWDSYSNRTLQNYNLSSSTGNYSTFVPYMLLSGSPSSLEQETFGSIKILLGR
jgi:hypothetical protein